MYFRWLADFGDTCFLPAGLNRGLRKVVAQAKGSIFGNLCKGLPQFLVSKVPAFFEEVGKIFENALDRFYVCGSPSIETS